MKNTTSILTISVLLLMISFTAGSLACYSQSSGEPSTGGQVVVQQSGGAAKLIAQCGDRSYVAEMADYILDGTVLKVESQWNDAKTNIYTYTNLKIDNYIKGSPFAQSEILIVTPGGTVGDITQAVEDQPIFHEGNKVRLYLEEVNGRYVIVCGPMGVEAK